MPLAMIVHGGAGSVSPLRARQSQEGCRDALLKGWQILHGGGSALDAVEAAVCALEDNPQFNAGTGSCLTREGKIEMDAGIMDGQTLRVGAVAGVECIKNPIALARKVLESPHVLLLGRGAQYFAQEQGIALCAHDDLLTQRQLTNWQRAQGTQFVQAAGQDEATDTAIEKKHGTVGAVAIDAAGQLAAATSTGGIMNKYPGRVGDSPLVGCGFYADDYAAVSCTGYGEDFTRLLIARRAAEYVARGVQAQLAADEAVAFLGSHAEGTGGLILLDAQSKIGFARNTRHMACAYLYEGMQEPEVTL